MPNHFNLLILDLEKIKIKRKVKCLEIQFNYQV